MELSNSQVQEALNHLLEYSKDPIDGIIRQILSQGVDSLSENQMYHYKKTILPNLIEGCNISSCDQPTVAGRTHCGSCAIEYGTDSEHTSN